MYVRVLDSTGEYGIITHLYGWMALLLVMLTYGMETGFFRFVNKREEHEPERVYATALYCLAGTSTLFLTLCLLFLQPLSRGMGYAAHPEYIAMLVAIVAVDAFCCLPFADLRRRNRPWRFAVLRLTNMAASICLNVFFLVVCPWIHARSPQSISWFYLPEYGAGYILVANTLSSLLLLLLLLPEIGPGFRARPSIRRLRLMLPYVFPVLLLGLAGIFNQNADKMLFPFLFNDREFAEAQLGIYGACFKIAVVMVMFIQAFRYAYEPFIFAREKERDSRTANAVVMKYFVIFSLALFLAVTFYMDVIKYFVVPAYYAGLKVVPVVMLGELFAGIYFNLSIWYKLTDRTVWGARFAAIGCVVTVTIMMLCVPRWGFMACAWALFSSNLLMMLLSYAAGQRHYRVDYDLRSAGTYALLAGALYSAGMWPNFDHPAVQLAYRTFLLALYIIYMVRRDLWPTLKRRTNHGM